jgi:hypothetical protein
VRRPLVALLAILLLAGPAATLAAADEDDRKQARAAALIFGKALTEGDAALLRTILPQRGKIQVRLIALGPGEGFYSAGQVESLIRDFLEQGSVASFELLGVEHDADRYALARGRAMLTDRQGRSVRAGLHLAFQPEEGRWVLREIRETHP